MDLFSKNYLQEQGELAALRVAKKKEIFDNVYELDCGANSPPTNS